MPWRFDDRCGYLCLALCAWGIRAQAAESIVIREFPATPAVTRPLEHRVPRSSASDRHAADVSIQRASNAKPDAPQVDLSVKPLAALSIAISPPGGGGLPVDRPVPYAAEGDPGVIEMMSDRPWQPWNYAWEASSLCHRPLYFEEKNLERYGHNAGRLQPAFSAVHFFATIPILPYKMTLDPPNEVIYTLGHTRPGDPAPWERTDLRWDARAAAVEAGVVTGLIFALP